MRAERSLGYAALAFVMLAGCSSPESSAQNSSVTGGQGSVTSTASEPGQAGVSAEAAGEAGTSGRGSAMSTTTATTTTTTTTRASAGTAAAAGMAATEAGAGAAAQAPAAGSGGAMTAAAGISAAGQAAAGARAQDMGPLTLELVDGEDLGDGFLAFPESARPPTNQSPPFRWSGGPAAVKSYALVFRDVTSAMPPVKWVLWNIPPERKQVPANVPGSSAMPSEVPGASQLGSLGNQGFAGPCCVGNKYEWIVYALDVAELPGTAALSTAQINMDVLPMHTLEKSKPLMLRIKD